MSAIQWKINGFDAACCITLAEINRKLKEVYETTDQFPKKWYVEDKEDPEDPLWVLDAPVVHAPSVNFASEMKNGINLVTPLGKKANFTHLVIIKRRAEEVRVPLQGAVFYLQTPMKNVEHVAGVGETVDQHFTVQALYADLQNPNKVKRIDSGYMLTREGLDLLAKPAVGEPPPPAVLNSLKNLVNKPFTTKKAFQDAACRQMEQDGIAPAEYSPFETQILTAGKMAFKAPDRTRLSIAGVLDDMLTNGKFRDNYIIGRSRLPKVEKTTGPLTPRALRYSTFQDKNDTAVGSLNWNIMVSGEGESLPALPTENIAGIFNDNPVPEGEKGVLIVSFEKVIETMILKDGFTSFGLPGDRWVSKPAQACAVLNEDVPITGSEKIKSGTFKAGVCKVYPEPEHNRIRADFSIENLDVQQDFLRTLSGFHYDILDYLMGIEYSATFSGYFTPRLETSPDGTKRMAFGYKQDTPFVNRSDAGFVGEIVRDVIRNLTSVMPSLVAELMNMARIQKMLLEVNQSHNTIIRDIKNTVMLPGNAVFEFNGIAMRNEGLCCGLTYR